MKNLVSIILLFFALISCSQNEEQNIPINTLYFPPLTGNTWQTTSVQDLQWNQNNVQPLLDFLEENDTKGFIILKNGKIVIEAYFNGHDRDANWYWASAGKIVTALTVGIAQQEGFLSINDKTSDYLGEGWTSLSAAKENLITIKHQLTMTTGLDDIEFACTDANCLTYIADAGTRWAYHNSPYTLLQSVVSNAVNQDFDDYFNSKIKNKIGMDGFWTPLGYNKLYWSTTRSMARFGLSMLNNAKWEDTILLDDMSYFNEMTTTSQNFNKSYGYLWWLNGKDNYMIPSSQTVFDDYLIPNAPSDLFAGLGKNDQKVYIIPSKDLVIIRMGDAAGGGLLGPSSFDNELWGKLNDLIN